MLEHRRGLTFWIGGVLAAAGVLLALASPAPAGVVDVNATSFDRALARTTSAPMIPRTPGVLTATAARFGSVLVLEEECGGSPPYMLQALDNLGIVGSLVTEWNELDSALTAGTPWDLVLVSSYGNNASAQALDKLNTYLAAGGLLVFSYWASFGQAAHPLFTSMGVSIQSSFSAPLSQTALNAGHPIFTNPNQVTAFVPNQDQCGTDGQIATALPGASRLAAFDSNPTSGSIILSPTRFAIFNGFIPGNFTADSTGNGKPDMVELMENQVVFLATLNTDFVTAIYTGAKVDTVPSTGHAVKVAYLGSSGATSGDFVYRQGGIRNYSRIAMRAGTGDTLLLDIPLGLLGAQGLHYYFEVRRGGTMATAGSADDPYEFVISFSAGTAQARRPDALPDALYRIVSVPVNVTGGNSVVNVFLDDLGDPKADTMWRLFSYDPAIGDSNSYREYPTAADVLPKQAYWLIARGGKRYGAEGFSRRATVFVDTNIVDPVKGAGYYYPLTLDSLWNQVANPLPVDIDWGDVLLAYANDTTEAHPDSLIRDSAYVWFGSYSTAGTIQRWSGVFLEARRSNVTALFRYESASGAATRVRPPEPQPSAEHWTLKLRLENARFADDGNFIGVRPDALRGPDRYDFTEPPPAPTGVQMGFRLPEGDDPRLQRTDYRPPFAEGESWQLEFTPAANRRLSITGFDQVPAGLEAVLILDDGHTFELREGSVISLPDDAATGRLVVGTSDFAAQEKESVRPDSYALHQNFPNPFNPRTSIRFSLPEATLVKVSIYNVLGQRVRVLVNGQYEAGSHDVVWDGKNSGGEPVGSGVYFYRLESSTVTLEQRMLLLK